MGHNDEKNENKLFLKGGKGGNLSAMSGNKINPQKVH
jgi:hypothetical protein|tara:strand:- start:278 stop:388 length:111 start_codon:yes stop_codon:yes gene_type:complete